MKDGLLTYSNGTRFWYKDDKLHRLDGPAAVYPDGGTRFWYKDGKCHRLDGPAIIYPDGSEYWYKNGLLHRVDGPAVIYQDGSNWINEWWYEGKLLKINQESIKELLEVVVG